MLWIQDNFSYLFNYERTKMQKFLIKTNYTLAKHSFNDAKFKPTNKKKVPSGNIEVKIAGD